MKYVIFKNSLHLVSVELPENFEKSFEIACFETPEDFNSYLHSHSVKCYQSLLPELRPVNREPVNDGFFIRQDEFYHKVCFNDILWVEASRSYCYIHLASRRSAIIVTHPLSDVRKKLPPGHFVQIHRSFIVRMSAIEKFIGNMVFIGDVSLPIGKKYRKRVLECLDVLDSIKETPGNGDEPDEKETGTFGNNG